MDQAQKQLQANMDSAMVGARAFFHLSRVPPLTRRAFAGTGRHPEASSVSFNAQVFPGQGRVLQLLFLVKLLVKGCENFTNGLVIQELNLKYLYPKNILIFFISFITIFFLFII